MAIPVDEEDVHSVPYQLPTAGRQAQAGPAAGLAHVVLQDQGAAVGFGDLAAERQAEARTMILRGEEGHEDVRAVGQPWIVVVPENLDRTGVETPGCRRLAIAGASILKRGPPGRWK